MPLIKKLLFVKSLIIDVKNNVINMEDVLNKKYIKTHYIFTKELLIDSLHNGFYYKYKCEDYKIHNSEIYIVDKFIKDDIDSLNKYIYDVNNILYKIKQHILTLNLFDVTYILIE